MGRRHFHNFVWLIVGSRGEERSGFTRISKRRESEATICKSENGHSIYRRVYLQFKSFLSCALYIYIHLVLLSSACECATTVLEEGILSLSRFWKLRKKREPSYLFFIRSFLRLLTFSSRLIFSILERTSIFFFFVYPLFTKENFSWNIYELNIIITIIIIIHVLRETKKLSLDRFSRRLDTDPRFV